MKILIILCCYNEQDNIEGLIKAINVVLRNSKYCNPIFIIVDDGSEDKTYDSILSLKNHYPIELVRHEVNLGFGISLRDGLNKVLNLCCTDDVVICLDADNSHRPFYILNLIRMIREGFDFVIASRYKCSSRTIGLSLFRRSISYFLSLFLRVTYPIKGVRDYTSGFRAISGRALIDYRKSFGESFIIQEGFAATLEFLLKFSKLKHSYCEIPFILRYDMKRGESKMNLIETIQSTLSVIKSNILGDFHHIS